MPRSETVWRTLSWACLLFLIAVPTLEAQYVLQAPSGHEISFAPESLKVFLVSTRALYADLEQDPRVMYVLDFDEGVSSDADGEDPGDIYPWDRVSIRDDSVAIIVTPGNLREGARAFYNYAVQRMRVERGRDLDVSCDRLMEYEVAAVSSFVDGWVVARTLFGGPEYAPLDELAFARAAGLLDALVADREDRHLGSCALTWADAHPERIEEYRRFRLSEFRAPQPEPAPESEPEPEPDTLIPDIGVPLSRIGT